MRGEPAFIGTAQRRGEQTLVIASVGATPQLEALGGAVLDAHDLTATRAFYSRLFTESPGEWEESRSRLVFRMPSQRIEFVKRSRPRTLNHAGQHTAYRISPDRLQSLARDLEVAGHHVNWWREDHPNEKGTTLYTRDPSGNIVQLVGSSDLDILLDHYYVPVEDIEQAELFYLKALAASLDAYFGYRTEDVLEARRWEEGKDPCAPWTRNAFVSFRTQAPNPTPAAQIFARFGPSYVGVALSGQRLPEPSEERLKATPRAIIRSRSTVREFVQYLSKLRISAVALKYDGGQVPYKREGNSIYLRDRSGNFFEIACA